MEFYPYLIGLAGLVGAVLLIDSVIKDKRARVYEDDQRKLDRAYDSELKRQRP